MKNLILFAALFSFSLTAISQTIDQEKSMVKFAVKNLWGMNTVRGTIGDMQGKLHFKTDDLAHSSFDMTVRPATIKSGIDKRDKDLRSAEFFDVEKYPTIQFKSSSIQKSGTGFETKGTLTIKEISKEVTIPFTIMEQNGSTTFSGKLNIVLDDYGLGASYGVFKVGKEAAIEIVCVLKK
ncbi:MAG: YceI family protein [Saprospiraceae bacterium]